MPTRDYVRLARRLTGKTKTGRFSWAGGERPSGSLNAVNESGSGEGNSRLDLVPDNGERRYRDNVAILRFSKLPAKSEHRFREILEK